ncbi:hypothetical protein GCM10010841_06570 [Deinococcus aerophilus]|uniref:Histidine kinase n=1 Tax=Deinococcus aerophilus TaxID=522488 RepID=A0ABQ2GLD6_9DEIO|nr:PAS domain S-box protein [Deinococcus aerophilus]GGM00650.1 hypothetical protein GCM10010841_06570 [Deinococcus aerophilus]
MVGVVVADARQDDYPILYVNPAFERLTGYPAAELLGRNCRFLQGEDRDQEARQDIWQALAQGEATTTILRNYRKDGTLFYNELTLSPVFDAAGTLTHYLGFQNDVTAREKALRGEHHARQQLTATLTRVTDGFVSFDRDWNVTYINEAAAGLAQRRPEDFLGRNLLIMFPEIRDNPLGLAVERAKATGDLQNTVSHLPHFEKWVDVTVYPSEDGISLFARDITESHRNLAALQASEERFSKVFQASPVAIFITRRKDKCFLEVNAEFLRQSGYSRQEILGHTSQELGFWADQADREVTWQMLDGELAPGSREVLFLDRHGEPFWGMLSLIPIEVAGERCVIGFVRNVNEEKNARQRLLESEERHRRSATELQRILDLSLDMITTVAPGGWVISVSAACVHILGYTPEELSGRSYEELLHPEDREITHREVAVIREKQGSTSFRNRCIHKDGGVVWIEWNVAAVPDDPLLYCVARDVTRRRAAEADQAFLAAIVQASQNAVVGVSLDDTIRSWNPGARRLYGYSAAEAIGQTMMLIVPPEVQDAEREVFRRVAQGELVLPYESVRLDRQGQRIPVMSTVSGVLDAEGHVIGVSKITRDISLIQAAEAKVRKLNEDLERQLRHVTGLREIDQSIATSADLNVTLGMILENIRQQLEVDAATILLLDQHTLTLRCGAARGLSTALQDLTLRLGDGLAGQVALNRQPLLAADLQTTDVSPAWRAMLEGERLVAYYAVPVIAKGKVLGVIEVLHRQPFEPSSAWLEVFEVLTNQAAIAVDNAELLSELEHSNLELRLAYDETIEGWARALDLRDRETEGHSRRVTETTVELCRMLGFSTEELVDVRRGALLHDIGKMGIPDAILSKPGRLNDEEWLRMKEHASYAVALLSPIRFLRPALTIPQYHHEKWDGSGYPLGLRGEAIPLAARAFAVVDVYDALTSDRPYRKAWPREAATAHLRAGAGTHFDPQVVGAFLRLLGARP